MALDDFTGQNIQDTYQRVVQTENGAFADGTGSAINIITSNQTASFVTNSDTASFVTNSDTASFVTNSDTASFVTNSDTASFVITNSDVLFSNITASANISASGTGSFNHLEIYTNANIAGILSIPGMPNVSASVAAAIAGGDDLGNHTATQALNLNSNKIIGVTEITASGNISSSGVINATNINAGVPTSNAWQQNLQGSYFNNFNASTNVSEILRFMAGIISHSIDTASPTANTKTYASISENLSNTGTGTAASGYIPNNHDNVDFTYLIDNGFASIGGTIFPSKTIHTNTGYSISYSSNDGGSTSIGSNLSDTDLFGLGVLDSGNANAFKVSGSHVFKFYRSQTAYNNGLPTETSSSGAILTNSSFGTSNGLTIAKIESANPAVIPAAFQDGKFANVHSQNIVNWTNETLTNISASGWYEINTTCSIATGSQSDFTPKNVSKAIFWAPISNINIPSQTITAGFQSVTALSLTSQSLSGAPYVNGGEWQYNATASGMFDPLYAGNITYVISMAITDPNSNGTVDVDRKSGFNRLDISNGQLGSSGIIRNAAGTFRNAGDIPHRQDSASVSVVYDITGTGNTINETGFTDSVFNLKMRIRNRTTALNDQTTQNVPIHTAGTFGQPVASQSMGYFGGGTASDKNEEYFTNETYRRIISDSTSLTDAWNSETNLTLGDGGDLQVKPGYLVNPESSKGYWYHTDGYNGDHYKWYLREFDTDATSNQSNLIINLDNPGTDNDDDLVTFDSTTADKIAIGVIFSSAASTIFDVVKGNQSYGGTLNTTSTGEMNPFSDNVAIVGDFSSKSESAGTLTLGLNNGINQTINGTHDKIWLLIRYKGTPVETLQKITVSTS